MTETDLQRLERRLNTIESLLEQLLNQQQRRAVSLPDSVADIHTEIATVRAAGGDLVKHYKDKARATMRAGSRA